MTSFAVRQTFKPRMQTNQDDIGDSTPYDPEEAGQIIAAIKHFSTRSSHENVLSANDLREVLRGSSINPDTNPLAKKNVDELMKGKEAISSSPVPTIKDTPTVEAIGFSSSSIEDSIRDNVPPKWITSFEKNWKIFEEEKKDEEDDRDIPDDIKRQLEAMRGDDDHPQILDDTLNDENNEATLNEERTARMELIKAKRILAYSHPARASMARGFIPRTSGMAGAGIKRVATGISDGF